jgi:hypothetical protein
LIGDYAFDNTNTIIGWRGRRPGGLSAATSGHALRLAVPSWSPSPWLAWLAAWTEEHRA